LQCYAIHEKAVAFSLAYRNNRNAFDDVAHAKAAMSKEEPPNYALLRGEAGQIGLRQGRIAFPFQ
jgi:hypothetical protein